MSMWIKEGFGSVAVLSFSSAYGCMSFYHVDIKDPNSGTTETDHLFYDLP